MDRYGEFAEQWLRQGSPSAAALAMGFVGLDAIKIAQEWPNKLEVILAKQELLAAHGEAHFLPSKHEQARAVWERAQECREPGQFEKLMRLYAEIMGNMAPKEQRVSGELQQAIVFEMIQPAAVKPVIDITPERIQIEAPKSSVSR